MNASSSKDGPRLKRPSGDVGVGVALGLATLIAMIAIVAHPARAAVMEAWAQSYNSVGQSANDQGAKVAQDAVGDIIVVGSTDNRTTGWDMLTIKYSGVDGSMIWQHRYNSPANASDNGVAVVVDQDNNVIVTGSSWNSTNDDFYTAKYAAVDGTLLWERRYNGPANGSDSPVALAVDHRGDVVMTGASSSVSDSNNFLIAKRDFYTAKYASADGALVWERRYNGPTDDNDRPQAMALDADGNVVVTGSSAGSGSGEDYYTAKYAAADGALLWQQRYNGPANGSDWTYDVAVDSSGNAVVTGVSLGLGSTNRSYASDYCTVKYAAVDGALLWERRYNGPADSYDAAYSVVVDGSDNVVVTGSSTGTNGSSESCTVKYAATDGALLWERRSTNGASLVALDNSDHVLVTGPTFFSNHGVLSAAKYAAADGAVLWATNRGFGRITSPGSMVVSSNGDVVVTGGAEGTSHKDWNWFILKLAGGDGASLWEKRYDGPANLADYARGLAVDKNGNVVVTGDSLTIKYSAADGSVLWKLSRANAVAIDGNGNVALAGTSSSYLNGNNVAKYTPGGDLLWAQRYDTLLSAYIIQPTTVAVDSDGNVVVTGETSDNATFQLAGFDFYTAKFAAADGGFLWGKRFNGPANNRDSPKAIAVDDLGNVVVTGISYSDGAAPEDSYTAKYAAADGALLWERRYNGPATNNDATTALAVDRSGNVVVAGYSHNGTNHDYYTAKYAATSGAILWEKRYNGPANGDDTAGAVAVDGYGNVVVTGTSKGTGDRFDYDYYTAKYAAANGALLWERRYNSPTNGSDEASKVAVDSNGNVVVAGVSGGDYYTAKYAAGDGALLWEKRFSAFPRRFTYLSGLALGPDGMIAVTGLLYASFVSGVLSDFDYATVVYRDHLPAVEIAQVSEGIRLRFTGATGRSYEVQRAETVTGPWITLSTPVGPPDGLIEYLDAAPLPGAAYYRIATTP